MGSEAFHFRRRVVPVRRPIESIVCTEEEIIVCNCHRVFPVRFVPFHCINEVGFIIKTMIFDIRVSGIRTRLIIIIPVRCRREVVELTEKTPFAAVAAQRAADARQSENKNM